MACSSMHWASVRILSRRVRIRYHLAGSKISSVFGRFVLCPN
jgi:hypothetical protein